MKRLSKRLVGWIVGLLAFLASIFGVFPSLNPFSPGVWDGPQPLPSRPEEAVRSQLNSYLKDLNRIAEDQGQSSESIESLAKEVYLYVSNLSLKYKGFAKFSIAVDRASKSHTVKEVISVTRTQLKAMLAILNTTGLQRKNNLEQEK